jgi:hypothetical protein
MLLGLGGFESIFGGDCDWLNLGSGSRECRSTSYACFSMVGLSILYLLKN